MSKRSIHKIPRKACLLSRGEPRVRAQTVDWALAIVADLLIPYHQLCSASHLDSTLMFSSHSCWLAHDLPLTRGYQFLDLPDFPLHSSRLIWRHSVLRSGFCILPLLFQAFYEIVLLSLEKRIVTDSLWCCLALAGVMHLLDLLRAASNFSFCLYVAIVQAIIHLVHWLAMLNQFEWLDRCSFFVEVVVYG